MEQQGEIVLYQPETTFKLEVRLENETVWLTQAQIAELFGTGRQAITKHLKEVAFLLLTRYPTDKIASRLYILVL